MTDVESLLVSVMSGRSPVSVTSNKVSVKLALQNYGTNATDFKRELDHNDCVIKHTRDKE